MRSRQQAVIQGNWMERPAFQSKTARTPKCDNDVLVSARHILWHVGKGKSGTVIPPLHLLHELPLVYTYVIFYLYRVYVLIIYYIFLIRACN